MLNPVIVNNKKFKGCIGSGRWTLCLGAGISRGFSPTWFELTNQIVNEVFDLTLTPSEFDLYVKKSQWNLDAWIQASANYYNIKYKGGKDFNLLIEHFLYNDILKKSENYGLSKYIKDILVHPKSASKKHVLEVCEFIETEYGENSLVQLVKTLNKASKLGKKPTSIITFNADTLLETFIDLFLRREHYLGPPPHNHPTYYYKSIKRLNDMSSDKTFIYHCHGAIIPDLLNAKSKTNDSRDRLIFLEEQYLQIANARSSWAETLFMFHALSSNMVFLGLSMSDSNIRRWLATAETEYKRDFEEVKKGELENPRHLWITQKINDDNYEKIILSSLIHLGVRPAYLDNWAELEKGLTNMLAI
jgi:hypothetical protein